MIAIGNNNISNIKIGGTQVKNVYIGTSGVWTNKTKLDYIIVEELTFQDHEALAKDSGQLQGMQSTIVKSTSDTADNYSTLATIPYSTSKTLTYYNPYTTLTQSNSFSDIIYKSDLNKFKLTTNQLHNYYAGSSVPINGGSGSEVYHNLDDSNAFTVVTNGAYNGSVVLKNQPLDTSIDLKINGYETFHALGFKWENPVLTNGALTIKFYIKIDTSTNFDPNTYISNFRFYNLNCNLSAYDDAGIFFDFNENRDIPFDDGTAIYSNNNGVCEMTWVWNFPPSTMGFIDPWAECSITPINTYSTTLLSVNTNKGTVDLHQGNISTGVYMTDFFLNLNGDWMDWLSSTALTGNIQPINTVLKNYKITMNWTLTDIYD